MSTEILPLRFGEVDTVMSRGLFDVGEGQRAVRIGNVRDLIEACHGVADVARIGQRFLALFGERIDAVREIALTRQPAVFLVRTPSTLHANILPKKGAGQVFGNETGTLVSQLTKEEGSVGGILWTIIVILFFFWLFSFLFHFGGGLIHLLLIVVLILVIVNLVRGRGPTV
jgi:hypothetical protein